MKAVEFQTSVKNGTIQIPEKYKAQFENHVRVVLMREEKTAGEKTDIIDRLMENPLKVANFKPLSREASHQRVNR
jgi:hypothetical protein